jgi:drug/metabolite transporter (DMT)-like permease
MDCYNNLAKITSITYDDEMNPVTVTPTKCHLYRQTDSTNQRVSHGHEHDLLSHLDNSEMDELIPQQLKPVMLVTHTFDVDQSDSHHKVQTDNADSSTNLNCGTGVSAMGMYGSLIINDKYFKLAACLLLCVQNSAAIVFQRYSRSILKQTYLNSMLVLCIEFAKLMGCTCMIIYDEHKTVGVLSLNIMVNAFYALITTSIPMAIPGVIYVLQNGLQMTALQHLDASVYAVLSQLKILSTALLATVMLHQFQSYRKWRALLLLVVGVVLTEYHPSRENCTNISSSTGNDASSSGGSPPVDILARSEHYHLIGLCAVLGAACTSGLAGVYLEKKLKSTSLSVW